MADIAARLESIGRDNLHLSFVLGGLAHRLREYSQVSGVILEIANLTGEVSSI